MSSPTERLRNHVASYKSMSSHRQNCLDVCDEVERLTAKLERIDIWCNAYPRTVFIEPTKTQWRIAEEMLAAHKGDNCPSLAAISGSNMRHVVEGIKALAEDKT